MARDDWRIRIELPDEEGARGLLERLGLARSDAGELAEELRDERLGVSQGGETGLGDAPGAVRAAHAALSGTRSRGTVTRRWVWRAGSTWRLSRAGSWSTRASRRTRSRCSGASGRRAGILRGRLA